MTPGACVIAHFMSFSIRGLQLQLNHPSDFISVTRAFNFRGNTKAFNTHRASLQSDINAEVFLGGHTW